MRIEYIHFLHRLTTMGLLPPSKCGCFRKIPVHILANVDLFFPSPSLITGLMNEYCDKFPIVLEASMAEPSFNGDIISMAARASHGFVRIHPYVDGNGRLSRLIMNLVLSHRFPPVYLKADKKGKHRYVQALKRADRGNIEPLACFIANALNELYDKLLLSVS